MPQVQDCPRYRGRKTSRCIVVLEAQSGLDAQATRNVWMIHKFVLFSGKIAIDRECPVHFVDKDVLGL
jgi:hypothetical protein